MTLPITKKEYNNISSLVMEKSGIRLGPESYKRMAIIINERARKTGLKSPHAYVGYLKSGKNSVELDWLVNEIAVPETYFFRDNNQCDALRYYILPELIKSIRKKRLRIWSAGCSTGEEAYTIAFILTQAIYDLNLWDIEIIGTDINKNSIKKSKNGVYTKNSFRGVEKGLINRYFHKTAKGMMIKEPAARLAAFEPFNMKLDKGGRFPDKYRGFDIIFCRNVLIYFEEKVSRNIINGFIDSLNPGGYFITGHAEAFLLPREFFLPLRTNDTYIYQKKEKHSENRIKKSETKDENLSPLSAKLPLNNLAATDPPGSPKETAQGMETKKRDSYDSAYQNALVFYFQEKYAEASVELEKLTFLHDVDAMRLASLIKINLRDFDNARGYAEKMRGKNEFLPDSYYIEGLVYENENDYERAIKAYETVLFLDDNFFLSHFRLGHLYGTSGRNKASARAFKNGLAVIKNQDDGRIRILSGGFTKKTLEDICKRRNLLNPYS